MINALGPVTPFLKSELGLSYTGTSLVFSAFAAGMILTGLLVATFFLIQATAQRRARRER